jgi:hypothetical protein
MKMIQRMLDRLANKYKEGYSAGYTEHDDLRGMATKYMSIGFGCEKKITFYMLEVMLMDMKIIKRRNYY